MYYIVQQQARDESWTTSCHASGETALFGDEESAWRFVRGNREWFKFRIVTLAAVTTEEDNYR